MGGFFGLFDYNKPGPGVPDNAPPKSPFIVFFEILQRKFWNFIKINFLFLVFDLPAILLGYLVMLFLFPNIFPNAFESPEMITSEMLMKFILLTPLFCIPMITVGPAQAGFTYVLRNYAREEHAFLWSDFKDAALKNFKQSMIIGTINFIATFLMLFSIRAYSLINNGNVIIMAGMVLMVILFLIFAMVNIYIYPLLVTFDLPIKQIYKNALIFASVKFFPNLGILLLSAFIILLTYGMIIPFNQFLGILFLLLITASLVGFITNFYAYPKLKKYMISRIEDEEDDEDDEDDEEDEDEDAEGGDVEEEDEEDEDDGDKKVSSGAGEAGIAQTDSNVTEPEAKPETKPETKPLDDSPDMEPEEPVEASKDEHTGDDGVKRYF